MSKFAVFGFTISAVCAANAAWYYANNHLGWVPVFLTLGVITFVFGCLNWKEN
jgi:hypothetical protein